MDTDYVIVGGGIVGLSAARGLLRRGRIVTVLDGEDGDFHASCCIFGRVRVQGKGLSLPRYAEWSQLSASLWASFRRGVGRRGGQVRTGKTVTEVSKPDAFLAICSDGPRGRATVRTG